MKLITKKPLSQVQNSVTNEELEQNITDLEISLMEKEQTITDLELELMEIKEKIGG